MESFYSSLGDGEKRAFVGTLFRLHNQFLLAVGFPQPYYLVLDHSLLVALRDGMTKDGERASFLALSTFCHFLTRHSGYDVKASITPLSLFEWLERKPLRDEARFHAAMKEIAGHLASVGLPLYQAGCGSFKEARKNIDHIIGDVKRISGALAKVRGKKWEIEISQGDFVYFPPYLTERLVPKIRLRYFSPHYVRSALRSNIDRELITKSSDKYVRSKLRNEGVNKMAALVKFKKAELKGAGDLGLLQVCDLGSQFLRGARQTMVGLTLDGTLEDVLRHHSALHVDSEPIVAGRDDEESMKRKITDCFTRASFFDRQGEAQREFRAKFAEFFGRLANAWEPDGDAGAGT
jgi:hypothetical protein